MNQAIISNYWRFLEEQHYSKITVDGIIQENDLLMKSYTIHMI